MSNNDLQNSRFSHKRLESIPCLCDPHTICLYYTDDLTHDYNITLQKLFEIDSQPRHQQLTEQQRQVIQSCVGKRYDLFVYHLLSNHVEVLQLLYQAHTQCIQDRDNTDFSQTRAVLYLLTYWTLFIFTCGFMTHKWFY
jgi:hypothetical protein